MALFESRRGEDGLLRAQRSGDRLVALLRAQVPRPARIRSEKLKELWVLALPDEPPLIEITPAMATRVGVQADELAAWWLALLRDQLALRRGDRPEATRDYEREHPIRKGGPVSPLFEKVYDRARHRVREGPLTTGAILEAIESLSEADRDRFRQAAREVPRTAPK